MRAIGKVRRWLNSQSLIKLKKALLIALAVIEAVINEIAVA